jgi:hypothetical protein
MALEGSMQLVREELRLADSAMQSSSDRGVEVARLQSALQRFSPVGGGSMALGSFAVPPGLTPSPPPQLSQRNDSEVERLRSELQASHEQFAQVDHMRQSEADLLQKTLEAAQRRASALEHELQQAARQPSVEGGDNGGDGRVAELQVQLAEEKQLRARFANLSIKLEAALSVAAAETEAARTTALVPGEDGGGAEEEARIAELERQLAAAQDMREHAERELEQQQQQQQASRSQDDSSDLAPELQQRVQQLQSELAEGSARARQQLDAAQARSSGSLRRAQAELQAAREEVSQERMCREQQQSRHEEEMESQASQLMEAAGDLSRQAENRVKDLERELQELRLTVCDCAATCCSYSSSTCSLPP